MLMIPRAAGLQDQVSRQVVWGLHLWDERDGKGGVKALTRNFSQMVCCWRRSLFTLLWAIGRLNRLQMCCKDLL